jgi:phosphatidate phosphatase APP1
MGWKDIVYKLGNTAENDFDRFKLKFRERMGWSLQVQICPFITYGNSKEIYIKGRVLRDRGIETTDRDSVWKNLSNMYKRFESTEIAGARLKIKFHNTELEISSDEDGYFESAMALNNPLPQEELWHHPVIELLDAPFKFKGPVTTRGRLITPPSTAQYGVISDIDDTILNTNAASLMKSAYMTFFKNAYSRMPFQGVGAFYKALQKGITGSNYNPIFYVSSSPWNLYDMLVDFMKINQIPAGPIFLKDYGFSANKLFSESHHIHKPKAIRNVLNAYPSLPFILIGDSGQKDPEIYAEIIKEFPGRILAVYIRDVSVEERDLQVKKISEGLMESKVEMVLAENSYSAAQHAASKGFIKPESLELIKAEKKADTAGEGSLEKMIEKEIPLAEDNFGETLD